MERAHQPSALHMNARIFKLEASGKRGEWEAEDSWRLVLFWVSQFLCSLYAGGLKPGRR